MKNNFLNFILYSILFLFFGCKEKQESTAVELITINVDSCSNQSPFLKDSMMFKSHFVKLENGEDCMLGWIDKACIVDSLIVIKDKNQNVCVFDLNGKFRNRVGILGRGPNEQLNFSDFYINSKEKYIAISDALKSAIFRYSYDGRLLEKIEVNKDLVSGIQNMCALPGGKLLIHYRLWPDISYNVPIFNESDYSFDKEWISPILKINNPASIVSKQAYNHNDKTFFTTLFSDTVYTYQENKVIPLYLLKSERKHTTSEALSAEAPYENLNEAMTFLENNNYSVGIQNIIANDRYIFFNTPNSVKGGSVIWDTKMNRGYWFGATDYDLFVLNKDDVYTSTEDAFVSVIPTMKILSQKKYYLTCFENPELKAIAETIQDTDNPVLGFYYINEAD